jgi:anti-anti-sigma factor
MRRSGSIETRPGAVPFVRLVGDHDLLTAREIRTTLQRELSTGANVVVSLERVTHLGSPAMGALVAAHMLAERNGLLLAVVVPPGGHRARRALEVTGLLDSLSIFERVRDAQRACEAHARPAAPAVALT